MALFDYVNAKIQCPNCGNEISHLKTYDYVCGFYKIDPTYIFSMHATCKICNKFIDIYKNIQPPKPRNTPYTLQELINLGFKIELYDR